MSDIILIKTCQVCISFVVMSNQITWWYTLWFT